MSRQIYRLISSRPATRCLYAQHKCTRLLPTARYNSTTSSATTIEDGSSARKSSIRESYAKNRWTEEDENNFVQRLKEFEERGPRNPLDTVTLHRLEAQRRAYYKRGMFWTGTGAVISMIMPLLILWAYGMDDLSPEELKRLKEEKEASKRQSSGFLQADRTDAGDRDVSRFRGKPVVVAPGGEKLIAKDETSGEALELVETGSTAVQHFPKTITIPSPTSPTGKPDEYTLLGLGVRTVSFLSLKVYVVGFYVQTSSLHTLQASLIKQVNEQASALIPGEKEQLKQRLLSPDESYAIWDRIIRETPVSVAIRIVPTRDTDFGHLRDGFVRGITQRTQQRVGTRPAAATGGLELGEYADAAFGAALKAFQALFGGRGKAPTGSVLLLVRPEDGSLRALWSKKDGSEAVEMGSVADERITRQLMLLYLGGKKVSSEPARESIVDGVMALVERPVGTLETKVQ